MSNIDGHYMLACCYSRKKEFDRALKQINTLYDSNYNAKIEYVLKLNLLLCMKTKPPQFDEAVLVSNILVQKYPEDMNSVSKIYCCNWT